jgi:hypothetical protein
MKSSSGPGGDTGIAPLGRIAWGSHFCNFYRAQSDLAESVVPFFQKALADNEVGIWITSDPLNKREVTRLLGQRAKVLDALQRIRGEAARHTAQFEDRGPLQLQP